MRRRHRNERVSAVNQRSPYGDAVREPAAKYPVAALASASIVSQHRRFDHEKERYGELRRRMGRTVFAVGGQNPRIFAIRAKVNVHAYLAFEPRTNNVQPATIRKSEKI